MIPSHFAGSEASYETGISVTCPSPNGLLERNYADPYLSFEPRRQSTRQTRKRMTAMIAKTIQCVGVNNSPIHPPLD
jgi:hypothetical protein